MHNPQQWAVVLNSGSTEIAFTKFNTEFKDIVDRKVSKNNSSISLEGKKYEDQFRSTVQVSDIQCQEMIFEEKDRSNIERVVNDGMCLLRDFKGLYAYCVIKDIDYSLFDGEWAKCTINFAETYNKFDVAIPIAPDSER